MKTTINVLQERKAPPWWVWRTWLCSGPFPQRPFSIPVMVCLQRRLWNWLQPQRYVKTEVQRCGFPTASVEHVFITKNSLFAVCWLSCSPTQRVFATSEPAAKTVPSSITATRTSMLDRLRWDGVFTCIAVKTESKKNRKLLLQHEHTDHCQHCDLKQKIMHLPLPGGVPGERGPGDCGGSRSDFARGPGSSWTFKERCTTLPSDHREGGILHLFKYMTSS